MVNSVYLITVNFFFFRISEICRNVINLTLSLLTEEDKGKSLQKKTETSEENKIKKNVKGFL